MVHGRGKLMDQKFPPIAGLLPHGDTIRMLDALDAWSDGYVQCSTEVRADSPFVQNDTLSTLVTLEHLAQTVAAYLGYEAHLRGQSPSIGMVVACRDFSFHRPNLQVGERLILRATMVQGDIERAQFHGEVLSDNELVAEGVLTLVRSEKKFTKSQ